MTDFLISDEIHSFFFYRKAGRSRISRFTRYFITIRFCKRYIRLLKNQTTVNNIDSDFSGDSNKSQKQLTKRYEYILGLSDA